MNASHPTKRSVENRERQASAFQICPCEPFYLCKRKAKRSSLQTNYAQYAKNRFQGWNHIEDKNKHELEEQNGIVATEIQRKKLRQNNTNL